VQVSEKDRIYSLPGHFDLIEPLEGASARVKNELLSARLDEGARPEPIHYGGGTSCTQEGNFDVLPLGDHREAQSEQGESKKAEN
jgi:hypothetical protein